MAQGTKNVRQQLIQNHTAATIAIANFTESGIYRFIPTDSITSCVISVDGSSSTHPGAYTTIIIGNGDNGQPGKVTVRAKSGKNIYCSTLNSGAAADKGLVNDGLNAGDSLTVVGNSNGDAICIEASGQWYRES